MRKKNGENNQENFYIYIERSFVAMCNINIQLFWCYFERGLFYFFYFKAPRLNQKTCGHSEGKAKREYGIRGRKERENPKPRKSNGITQIRKRENNFEFVFFVHADLPFRLLTLSKAGNFHNEEDRDQGLCVHSNIRRIQGKRGVFAVIETTKFNLRLYLWVYTDKKILIFSIIHILN